MRLPDSMASACLGRGAINALSAHAHIHITALTPNPGCPPSPGMLK